MATPAANLGYGHQTEATIDQANQAMRAMPWYTEFLRSIGQDPSNVHLNDSQRQQMLKQAQANGFVIDEGDMQVDGSGNIDKKGHAVRNTLIVAGIAAAAIAAPYIIPALTSGGGIAGGGAAASGLGGAGAAGLGAGSGITAAGIGTGGLVGGGAAAGMATAALPAALGGTLVGTAAPALAGSLSAGSMLGTAGTIAGAGGTAGTLGTAAKIGGALSGGNSYLGTAGKVAGVLGDYAAGRQADRMAEGNANLSADRNVLDLYRTQSGNTVNENNFALGRVNAGAELSAADLAQKNFALSAPRQRASNSVRGDILANAKDATVSGISPNTPVPTISGGLRPSMFSDNTRALGGEMSSQALASQKAGDTFKDLPALPDYVQPPPAPALAGLPQANTFDNILNTAASIGSIGGAMGSLPYRVPKPGDPDYVRR